VSLRTLPTILPSDADTDTLYVIARISSTSTVYSAVENSNPDSNCAVTVVSSLPVAVATNAKPNVLMTFPYASLGVTLKRVGIPAVRSSWKATDELAGAIMFGETIRVDSTVHEDEDDWIT